MDRQLRIRYEARTRVLKALAHPSRLLMVDVLAREERCVCELKELVGADMSTVSKHLTILRDAGLLEMEKRGAQVYYRLRTGCVTGFLERLEGLIRSAADSRKRLAAVD